MTNNSVNIKKNFDLRLNIDVLLIFLILYLSLIEGILPEVIQVIILITMLMRKSNYNINEEIKIRNWLFILSIPPIILFIFQLITLDLELNQVLYLFGINKNLYIGILIYLLARNYLKKIDNYIFALSLFLIYLNLGSLFTILFNFGGIENRVSFLTFASANYATALSTISIPIYFYYLNGFKKVKNRGLNLINSISIILIFMTVLFSGSRANILFLVVEVIIILIIIKKNVVFLLKGITVIFVLSLVIFFMISNVNNQILELFERGISVFDSVEDSARDLLWEASSIQFENSNKFIGNGSIMVQYYQKEAHNFIWELLLFSGAVGLIIYIIYVLRFVTLLLRKIKFIDRIYILLTLIVAYGIAFVQPFITTGYTFNILLWCTILVIYSSGRNKIING